MGDDRKVFARRGRGFPRGNRGHSGFRGRGRGGFRSRGHNRGSGMNHSEYNSSRAYSSLAGPRLAEFDVGITEFISKLSGFSAVLKHRYYDFHVNEIDCDGNIVKLTSLDIPKEETKEPLIGERHELIPEEVWLKLSNMVKSTGSGSSDTAAENNVKIDDHVEISLQDGKKSMNDMSADKEAASIENIGASQSKTAIKHEPQYIEFDVRSNSSPHFF